MIVGINYPWLNYDWDFGNPPAGWSTRAAWRTRIDQDLQTFRRCNIQVVRWFILGSGLLYGHGSRHAPHLSGNQWRFDRIPRIDPAILEDFRTLLQIFSRNEMLLLPVLIDFKWAFPGLNHQTSEEATLQAWYGRQTPLETARQNAARLPEGYVKGGRSDVIYDERKRATFFSQVLEPFLATSSAFRSSIFAWELINEPEWITRVPGGGLPDAQKIPFNRMLQFIRTGATYIQGYGFRFTIGFAKAQSIPDWNLRAYRQIQRLTKRGLPETGNYLNLDLNQIHYYPNQRISTDILVPATFPNQQGAILGEFSSATTTERWHELPPTHQSVTDRLRFAASKGYLAAIPWSYHATDPHTEPNKSTLEAAIQAYRQST